MSPATPATITRVLRRRGARADHARDEAEVRRQSVVESVHDVAQKSARLGAMPRLARASGDLVERLRVLGGFARERERLSLAGDAARGAAMHVEVAFDLASFFGEQHRQQERRAEAPAQQSRAGACARSADARATRRPCWRMRLAQTSTCLSSTSANRRYRDFFFSSGSADARTRYRYAASASSCQWCSNAWRSGELRGVDSRADNMLVNRSRAGPRVSSAEPTTGRQRSPCTSNCFSRSESRRPRSPALRTRRKRAFIGRNRARGVAYSFRGRRGSRRHRRHDVHAARARDTLGVLVSSVSAGRPGGEGRDSRKGIASRRSTA